MSIEKQCGVSNATVIDVTSRVLVCGASGMLGASLVPHLSSVGYEVVCLSRRSGVKPVDLTDWEATNDALETLQPNVILNLAALTNVDECERTPQLAYQMNVRIVENLTSWIRADGLRCRLVQISTDQVYDGLGPHVENATALTNYYAFSKYAGELAGHLAGATVLRTNFFGRSLCANRQSLSDWIVASLSEGKTITVFEDVFFSPLSLGTLVQLIERVVRKPRPGTFNLGSRDGMSKADFAFEVARALELPTVGMTRGASDHTKLHAYRPKDMRMDSRRFEQYYDVVLPSLREEIQLLRGSLCH